MNWTRALSLLAGLGSAAVAGPSLEAQSPRLTQHDVIPILLRRCAPCHGRQVQEAGLDLRTRASLLRGGKSGPAIVAGKPEESLLLKRVQAGEMPPRLKLVEASVKPIEAAEIETLARWIAAGAPEGEVAPDAPGAAPDPLVTDEDRSFWSFRPPRPAASPAVRRAGWPRDPIDAFILSALEERGLSPSPEAGRAALLRRLHIDLTGLPPEPGDVIDFLADPDPLAYEKRVDRLLASPRHGERWGRHWLDVAGYADSDGKREQDLPRPFAYRYRDYVIRSLDADKPYDRFLLEQLAGDELADYESAPEITSEIEDNLVATGFLRMAPDPTWASITNFVPDRIEVIADAIDVLGSGVLGLGLKCARCHDHKFDPIPQRDYYRLLDVFKGALDENDWLRSNWHDGISTGRRADRDLPYVAAAERRDWEAARGAIEREIEALKALGKDGEARIRELESRRTPEPEIRALWDRGQPSPTYIAERGDPLRPGRLVGPGVPAVLTDGKTPFETRPPWPGAKSTGRRLAFARWLVRPEHPLTARVIVNRVWRHHFGRGIVRTLGDFGKAGAPPAHPALLDRLAADFARGGWSLKDLHRRMTTSAVYRQASDARPDAEGLDPENALCSRMPLRRLEAEALYDSMLFAAGCLDERRFGPPDAIEARPDGLVTPAGGERGWRRMVYVRQERKQVPSILECFDAPGMNPNCLERRETSAVPQALHLQNDAMVAALAARLAGRAAREAGADDARRIERIYLAALGRAPEGSEIEAALETLDRLKAAWTADAAAGASGTDRIALASLAHVLFNTAEFLHVD